MTNVIEVEGGELEFVPTPGHVNVIARDGADEVELHLDPVEYDKLRKGIEADEKADIDTETGMIAWDPGRGFYVEHYDGPDFYIVCSPDDRETVASTMLTVRPGS